MRTLEESYEIRFGAAGARLAEDRRRCIELEKDVARDSQMQGGFYRKYVADNRPMKPYGGSPNLRPIQW